MPEDMRIEIACEVSTEAWGRLTAKHGAVYVDQHYNELLPKVIEEVREAVDEAERDYHREMAQQRQDWLDDYYQETAYGWHQQDIIDMYRRER